MPLPRRSAVAELVRAGLERVRADLDVPTGFPDPVLEAAASAAARGWDSEPGERPDRRALDLVTIDPAASRDLDQAVLVEARDEGGWRVRYAIADLGAFVRPGDPVDVEARKRGMTLYLPDGRAPLHPTSLSEGAASLLPGVDRPALLWTIDVDGDGRALPGTVERAVVRSREQLTYAEAQQRADAGDAHLRALLALGAARREEERRRGGISLELPEQEVVLDEHGRPTLRYRAPLPVEDANAHVSLLTGMDAAEAMLAAGVGLLRTLPPPEARALDSLRLQARALGVSWPPEERYPDLVARLDPTDTAQAALLQAAAVTLRGAGYAAFLPGDPLPDPPAHGALAAPYAHVTAPLRRLGDRFACAIALAVAQDRTPPAWALEALPHLPALLAAAGSRASAVDRAVVDLVEAVVLAPHVGNALSAVVVAVRDGTATVQLREPAVVARVEDLGAAAGDAVEVRVEAVDPDARTVVLAPA